MAPTPRERAAALSYSRERAIRLFDRFQAAHVDPSVALPLLVFLEQTTVFEVRCTIAVIADRQAYLRRTDTADAFTRFAAELRKRTQRSASAEAKEDSKDINTDDSRFLHRLDQISRYKDRLQAEIDRLPDVAQRQSLLTALETQRAQLSVLTFGAEANFLRASARALRRSLGFSPLDSPMPSPSPNLANLPSPRTTPYFPTADLFAPPPKTSSGPSLFAPLPSPHSLQTALSIADSFLTVGLPPAERAGSGSACALSWRTSRGVPRTYAPWTSWRVWDEPILLPSGPGASLRTGDIVAVNATWSDLSRPLERALRSRRIASTRLNLLHARPGTRLRVLAVFRARGVEWLAAAVLDAQGEDAEVGLLPVSCCVGGAGAVDAELHESAAGFVASTWTSEGQLVWLDGIVNASSIEWCRHGSATSEAWTSVRARASSALTSQYRLGEISGGDRAVHIHQGRELFVLTFRAMSTSAVVRLAFESNTALDRVVRDMLRAFPELDVR